jgi:hypothetical protein
MNKSIARRIFTFFALAGAWAWSTTSPLAAQEAPVPWITTRVSATPLVTHDPYFSVWSFADKLNQDWSRHWTGRIHAMCALARIDQKTFRVAGLRPDDAPPMEQTGCSVRPTGTAYSFESGPISATFEFCSPVLLEDLDLASRPVTYVSMAVTNRSAGEHEVEFYFDTTSEWVVNAPEQAVQWSRMKLEGRHVLRMGTAEQPVLQKCGDDLRIDWGYLYLMAVTPGAADVMQSHGASRGAFVTTGTVASSDDFRMPRPAHDNYPVLALSYSFGKLKAGESKRFDFLLAYDDLFSIEYFNRKLLPYWRRLHGRIETLLVKACDERAAILERSSAFDARFMDSMQRNYGAHFAKVAALAYRQAVAAQKIAADFDGTPLMFPKENFSNGCISTVDVIYPAAPIFLLFNPKLLRAQLDPVFAYARSARWKFDFAPHDLGTYPLANGQVYGGGEATEDNQMPVEETANMLLLVAGIVKAERTPDYAIKHWDLLTRWAEYLAKKGLDPENQLCTDDFAGHLAHNANLSVKAIVAIGAFGQVCEGAGKADDAKKWKALARDMATRWVLLAADGDHYKLAFDKPGTWSQKYNMIWDDVLGLGLFSEEIKNTELEYYKKKNNRYGLPLDNRATYTKTDWVLWTAAMARDRTTFDALVAPVVKFLEDTSDRLPFTDWYDTISARCTGFRARPVIGGVFMPMLRNEKAWGDWLARAR